MPPLYEWQTFFAVQAAAAATMTGLVFIAVSINLGKILETPGLSGRAAESLQHLLQVFFVCTAGLIPKQPSWALAVEILTTAILVWVLQVGIHIRYAKSHSGHPRSWLVSRIIQTHLAGVPFVISAVLILLDRPGSLYWLVPGFVFSFIAGILNVWILLIEILR